VIAIGMFALGLTSDGPAVDGDDALERDPLRTQQRRHLFMVFPIGPTQRAALLCGGTDHAYAPKPSALCRTVST
jgi:hypothetical protein